MKQKKIINYIKRFFRWLWSGKYHIGSFLSLGSVVLYYFGWLQYCPKLVSTLMTLFGLFIILYLLFSDAREFADHLPNTIPNWIKSFPRCKPTIVGASTAQIGAVGLKGRVSTSIPKDSPIEKKVDFLIQQVKDIQNEINQLDNRIDEVNTSLAKNIKILEGDISQASAVLEKIIASHAIGDYDLNLFGIVLTLSGTLIQVFIA